MAMRILRKQLTNSSDYTWKYVLGRMVFNTLILSSVSYQVSALIAQLIPCKANSVAVINMFVCLFNCLLIKIWLNYSTDPCSVNKWWYHSSNFSTPFQLKKSTVNMHLILLTSPNFSWRFQMGIGILKITQKSQKLKLNRHQIKFYLLFSLFKNIK